jgi:transcriptional regulator with XRE-family HTH domain
MADKNNINRYGNILQKLRKSKNMTQAELAEKTNIASNYISRIERNEIEPKISTLLKLKEALKVSGNALLGEMDTSLDGQIRKRFENIQFLTTDEQEYIMHTIDLVVSKHILKFANSSKMPLENYEQEQGELQASYAMLERLQYLK